jgi:multiple sugar transport system ATP-binding protein
MADRIFIMHNGALQQLGAPLEVYKQPTNRFVAGFIGSPAMNFIEARLIQEGSAYFIDAVGFKVRLPEAFYPKLEPYVGRQVIFGVRPEDMEERVPTAVGVHGNTLKARADVVESLGSETFVYLTCGPHAIVARMESPERPLTVGQTLEVDIKMSKTHLFDAETSRTIV